MSWIDVGIAWPSAGAGVLLLLSGVALIAAIETFSRGLRSLAHLPQTVLVRIVATCLVVVGGLILAGNYLAPAATAVLLALCVLLVLVNVAWLRAVLATVFIILSRRVRRGDRVRAGAVDGLVVGFHVGWLEVETPHGRQTISAAALLRSGGATVRGRSVAPDAELGLELQVNPRHERLEETVRQVVMCSAWLALSHRPQIVVTHEAGRATVRIRAWALSEAHLPRLESDVRTRCAELAILEETAG